MSLKKKLVLGCSIGNCVHIAGVCHFLEIAERENYDSIFLGPAISIDALFKAIVTYKPDLVAVGYRLTPENALPLLQEISRCRDSQNLANVRWAFGGTKPIAKIASQYDFFDYISDGYDDIDDSIRFLRGEKNNATMLKQYGKTLVERINDCSPYPIIRHHFGLPALKATVDGISEIASAKAVDVISLAPDQNTQQFFFHQDRMKEAFNGAGGVPIRSKDDFIALKQASQCGNFPLMRCYSGTEDVQRFAQILLDTIDNAWAAIPLSWYSELDGRGQRPITESMADAMSLIRWHATLGIPVEINEPHQWGLRDAHDTISVAMSYISAYCAKKLGVETYIAQYMFNTPGRLSLSMDLAKNMAMKELITPLQDSRFKIYTETRAGLELFHPDSSIAKGQLASSIFMQMCLKPHILHVVSFCEADHAATPNDIVESCNIAKGVIRHTLYDHFDIDKSESVTIRKEKLISEAKYLLNFILDEYSDIENPLSSPRVLCDCIKRGFIDAAQLHRTNRFKGNLKTSIVDGKCVCISPETGEQINENVRLEKLKNTNGKFED